MHMVGLLNTPWAIILPGLVNPFGVYLMRIVWDQGFENDLIEAARLDGASETRIFFRIGLPLVATGLRTVELLSFVGAWNNFFLPLIVVSDEPLYPLTLGLAIWNSGGTVTLSQRR
jgi:multiple sugar transport system permease protein